MDELISRKVALANYQRVCAVVACNDCCFRIIDGAYTDCRLERFLKELPSVDPEHKYGHWETEVRRNRDGTRSCFYACSLCGNMALDTFKYCPNCGGRNEVDENDCY